jgi:hypothetical protein
MANIGGGPSLPTRTQDFLGFRAASQGSTTVTNRENNLQEQGKLN